MAKATPKSIDRPTLEYFSYLGPHQVAIGDLGKAGLPGLIIAPASGDDLPVVALAHGWLQPAARYADTMRFLASWGIVVVAPNTDRGLVPSHGGLALHLQDALQIAASGRLAGGRVRVNPTRLGVLGHSIGGGAAVLAAANERGIGAVLTVTAAETKPSAIAAAGRVHAPGLHLVGGDDDTAGSATDSDGARIAAAWAGPSQLRTVKGVDHYGLAEGHHWTRRFLGAEGGKRAQKVTRELAAAFFLRHLAGQDQLGTELEGKFGKTTLEDLDEVREVVAGG